MGDDQLDDEGLHARSLNSGKRDGTIIYAPRQVRFTIEIVMAHQGSAP